MAIAGELLQSRKRKRRTRQNVAYASGSDVVVDGPVRTSLTLPALTSWVRPRASPFSVPHSRGAWLRKKRRQTQAVWRAERDVALSLRERNAHSSREARGLQSAHDPVPLLVLPQDLPCGRPSARRADRLHLPAHGPRLF